MRYLIALLLLLSTAAHAGKHESEYTREWCSAHSGEQEYTLADMTRVDCLTKEYAVEVDRPERWAESIGQSLFYAASTGRRPGIVMIMGADGDRYMRRLRMAIRAHELDITVWTVTE